MAKFIKYQGNGKNFINFDPKSLDGIEDLIRWAEVEVPRLIPKYMDQLTMFMALYNQGEARKMSFGPHDPTGRDTSLAWRTPEEGIRRITENYYLGWKVSHIRPGTWRVYNESREAYFIEFGISMVGWGSDRHVPANRIRRPVRKLTQRRTIQWALESGAHHRIWVDIYANPATKRGLGFTQIVQSRAQGSFTGPVGVLPG